MSIAQDNTCRFLVTCEHGGNRIPAQYRDLFAGQSSLLRSHRGYDPGALAMARDLAKKLGAPLICSTTSRLLVDLNRSPHHPQLLSEFSRNLPNAARREIIEHYYQPFRTRAEQAVASAIGTGHRVIHLSSHSFTPELKGIERQADIGLLYDPARPGEVALCREWLAILKTRAPDLRVRRNYPYTGKSDGLTAYLRKRHAAACYIGIELEINQLIVRGGGLAWSNLRNCLTETLAMALDCIAL